MYFNFCIITALLTHIHKQPVTGYLIFLFLFYFEQSGLETWLGTLYCVLEQDT